MSSDLRRLRYFVTIANVGSLARAAEVLHVAQSALTRQLRLLEDELGVPLMERGAFGVRLTVAGETYYKRANQLLVDHASARDEAQLAEHGSVGLLRLGTSDMFPWHPGFVAALRACGVYSPGIALRVEAVHSGEVSDLILGDQVDLALTYAGALATDALLKVSVWRQEGMRLVVSKESAMAERPPARLADIRDEPFVGFPRKQSPHLHEMLVRQFRQRGLEPRLVHEGQTPNTVLGLVAAGLGYSVVPQSMCDYLPPGVTGLTIPDLDMQLPISIVLRTDNRSPALARFVELLNGA